MALNSYFSNLGENHDNSNEQALVDSFVTECIQIMGINVKYLPRTEVRTDDLYGEDYLAAFNSAILIEMYVESIDGFEGDDEALAGYGMTIDDEAKFRVATPRFITETGKERPDIGDLVYMPITNSLFEIKRIVDDDQFLPLGSQPSFILVCESFTYSMETFDTGDPDIDPVTNKDLEIDVVNPMDGDNTEIQIESDQTILFDEDNPFGSF